MPTITVESVDAPSEVQAGEEFTVTAEVCGEDANFGTSYEDDFTVESRWQIGVFGIITALFGTKQLGSGTVSVDAGQCRDQAISINDAVLEQSGEHVIDVTVGESIGASSAQTTVTVN